MAGSGERVISIFIISHVCSIGKRSGDRTGRAVVVHHEEHVALQQPYMDVHCPAEKAHRLSVEEMTVTWG